MRFDNAQFEAAYGTFEQLPKSNLPEIVFAGRSNVGKSSLINKLLNRKSLARVSSSPGKTITINFYKLDGVRLADLPGYGYAKVSYSEKERWSKMMEGYFNSERDIRLVVQLVDMRHPPSKDDISMISFLKESGYNFIIAMTKSDKLNKTERESRLRLIEEELSDFEDIKKVPFSSMTGEGTDELRKLISNAL